MPPHFNLLAATSRLAVGAACFALALPVTHAASITAMEYYVDHDPGPGNATLLTAHDGAYGGTTETGEATLDTGQLEIGPHLLYVRARKSNGVWGSYPPQLLYIYQRTGIEEAEYYIDTDPGVGKGAALSAVDGFYDWTEERITASIAAEGLSVGDHVLYVRCKDTTGRWGPARAMPFSVKASATISEAECGIGTESDTQPTLGTFAMQPADFAWDSVTEEVLKNGVTAPDSAGTFRAFVRAKNDRDIWGPWVSRTFTVGLNAFASWIAGYGYTGNDALPGADPDLDGVLNIVEYACNMHPGQKDAVALQPQTNTAGLPFWELEDGLLSVEYLRRTDDPTLTYAVSFAADLRVAPWEAASAPPIVTPIDDTWERVRVTDSAAHLGAPHRFGTVEIQR